MQIDSRCQWGINPQLWRSPFRSINGIWFGLPEAVHFSITLTKKYFYLSFVTMKITNKSNQQNEWLMSCVQTFSISALSSYSALCKWFCFKCGVLLQRLWGQCKSRYWLCQVLFSRGLHLIYTWELLSTHARDLCVGSVSLNSTAMSNKVGNKKKN